MSKTHCTLTFGCQMNEIESGNYNQIFKKAGWKKTTKLEQANIVLINSCSVRQSAEDRVYGLGIKLKHTNPKPIVILTGCMVGSATGERTRFDLKYLKKKAHFVNYFVDKNRLPKFLEKLLQVENCIPNNPTPTHCNLGKMEGYGVPIMTGCNNFCSYCVVPYARGKEVYHPQKTIIKNVQDLIKKGHTKIILLGQNVNNYPNFPKLLETVHNLPELKKVGFMTANPWNFPDELIGVLTLPKVSRYLHLPVQSGNDEILTKMGRNSKKSSLVNLPEEIYGGTPSAFLGTSTKLSFPQSRFAGFAYVKNTKGGKTLPVAGTVNQYLDLVKKVRAKIPNIELGTDIIVGFPGETEDQFQDTLNLCKKVGFGQIYVSKYSPRIGTKAVEYKDSVELKEKKRRYKKVIALRNRT